MPTRRRQGNRSRKSSQNVSTSQNNQAIASEQQPKTDKSSNTSITTSVPNVPIKSIQFHSLQPANKNDHYATFLQILSSHPQISCSTFTANGKKCTLVFKSIESCEKWLQAFSKIKFKNHCIEILSTTTKPPSQSKLTLQIYKIDVKQFQATTSFEKIPMFRITPLNSANPEISEEIANSQAQNLAHLVTPDYLFGKVQLKEKISAIQFKEKSEAERYLDILKNVKLDFKYLVVEALDIEELQNSTKIQQNPSIAQAKHQESRSKSSSPARQQNTPKLQSNAGFLLFDAKNFNSEIARNISPLADIIQLPKNVIHVQFPKQNQAEEFFKLLKEKSVLKHTYKLTSVLTLKMPSDRHKLLTCMIWFNQPPTKNRVRELLPRSVINFDISKAPKNNNSDNTNNRARQWFIHCEFETSEIAQVSLIPLMQSLKLLNPNNMIFPTTNFVDLYDKERGISSHFSLENNPTNSYSSGNNNSDLDPENLFQARFRAVDRGKFGFVNIKQKCREFIIAKISGVFQETGDCVLPNVEHIKNALHGDEIKFSVDIENVFDEKSRKLVPINAVSIEKLNTYRLIAKVVKIERRDRDKVVGVLRQNCYKNENGVEDKNMLVFTPKLSALPYFLVDSRELKDSWKPEDIYKAKVQTSNQTILKNVENLGAASENFVDLAMEQLFVYYNISHENWSDEILSELPTEQEPADFTRRDFRNNCVFTIDPRTCRDMDDAIHIEQVGNGIFELGVHIADVSYYVNETNSPNLWQHAKRQSTSYYFPHTVIHMLPEKLSANLCSLCPHVERFTMSMTWRIDSRNWEILPDTFWYGRGVIRSRAKMAYEDVQVIMDEFDRNGRQEIPSLSKMHQLWQQFDEKNSELDNYVPVLTKFQTQSHMEQIISDVIKLQLFTRRLESSRNRIVIHSKMRQFVNFHLDRDHHVPNDISKTVHIEANRLIENLMLLANEWAAKTVCNYYAETGMIRKHPGLKITDFIKNLVSLEAVIADPGLLHILNEVKTAAVSSCSGDLGSVLNRIESMELKIFFSNLISLNMAPAEYSE